MDHKKIILVTGATGAQGSSVARALLAENQFAVRIFTRNASSEKAHALQAAGATIAEGDMNNIESLKAAMAGCYGVYGVTNFWEHFENEYQLGKNLVDAVKENNIAHFVFHTLPDMHKLSRGKYAVPHYDMKAALEQYTRNLYIPATFIRIAFYYENFFDFFPFQKTGDNDYSFGFPQGDTKLAMISAEDIGGMVATIFNHPDAYIKRVVGAVGADETCHDYAAIMSRVLGSSIQYNYIPHAQYAALGFPGAEELANMFEVQRLHVNSRLIDLVETYGLNPATHPFEQWVINNKSRFEKMMKRNESVTA